ncbi:EF-hand domain-containing protein [Achromobacter sp. UMC71]|uniref:EF-hand domain-containing protein n=1 Tax=Achromobacter sp. UMC71 TaxID=1862320 RepID=UPI00160296CB|nr:EF-hand domain-containing protein [Achromobacter sp. UMC71]MBB1626449.1 hypothetical protein [Achromobacter sp. UMC71]
MKNVTRTGSLTAALLLALWTGGAMAQSTPAAPAPAPTGTAEAGKAGAIPTPDAVNRPMTEPEYYARMEAAFDKQDINADGYLTRGPLLNEATSEQVAAMDTDGDGRISKAEFLDYAMKNFRSRPKYEMNRKPKP